MRLNEGLPVWHASVSLQKKNRKMFVPNEAERYALRALQGVGGSREWWYWNPAAEVGHLRVSVTPEEAAMIPPGLAVNDAGESGPERARTLP
jgi:hypothetical protein